MNMKLFDDKWIGLGLYEVMKMNLGFIFMLSFFPFGFCVLVAHLQPLLRTLGDLKKLKPWTHGGFCWPFAKITLMFDLSRF